MQEHYYKFWRELIKPKGFEIEKKALLDLINEFELTKITTKPHPFFGNMTKQDWDVLQAKHLDHHLNQFGV